MASIVYGNQHVAAYLSILYCPHKHARRARTVNCKSDFGMTHRVVRIANMKLNVLRARMTFEYLTHHSIALACKLHPARKKWKVPKLMCRAEQHLLTIDATLVQTYKSGMFRVRSSTNQCKMSQNILHLSQRLAANSAWLAIWKQFASNLICSHAVLVKISARIQSSLDALSSVDPLLALACSWWTCSRQVAHQQTDIGLQLEQACCQQTTQREQQACLAC